MYDGTTGFPLDRPSQGVTGVGNKDTIGTVFTTCHENVVSSITLYRSLLIVMLVFMSNSNNSYYAANRILILDYDVLVPSLSLFSSEKFHL